jgi:hypothetical protein
LRELWCGLPCCHAHERKDDSSDHDSDEEDHSPEGSETEKKEKDDEGLEDDDDSSSSYNSDDEDDEDDEDRRRDDWERSVTQHVLLLELRNFFNGRKMKSGGGAEVADVKCSAQDPLYTEVDRKVLEKEGVAVVDDPEGFLKVDEKTAVVCVYPNVPIRQIIADIARPAVIIWDRVEELEPQKKPVRWWVSFFSIFLPMASLLPICAGVVEQRRENSCLQSLTQIGGMIPPRGSSR